MKNVQLAINSTTDCDIANRAIKFYGADVATPVIDFINTKSPVIKTVYAAEVLGAATVSYTAANNTTYSFTVKQVIGNNEVVVPFSYTSDGSGTEAEIDAALGAALDILIASGALQVSYSVAGSSTIVITADRKSTRLNSSH